MTNVHIFAVLLMVGCAFRVGVQAKPKSHGMLNPYIKGCAPIECPLDKNDMYFPHPERCDAFCQCSNYVPYEMPCPVGLVFNPTVVPGPVCDWPENYECTIGQGDTPEQDCESIDCPSDVGIQYFVHPSECDAFCQCTNGTPMRMPCPPGLVYNPDLEVCVLPSAYDCPYDVKQILRRRKWHRQ